MNDPLASELATPPTRSAESHEAETLRRQWLALVNKKSGAETSSYADGLAALGATWRAVSSGVSASRPASTAKSTPRESSCPCVAAASASRYKSTAGPSNA